MLLFSHSVMLDSLWPHGLQHNRPRCPSPTPKGMTIESVIPSNHFILSHPLLLWPSIFPSIRVFSNESALCIRWPKYWSFSINPSSEYSGLISFRIDQFEFPAVQETLKSLLQHHNSKASILWCSAFFRALSSDFGAPKIKSVTPFGADAMISGCPRMLQSIRVCYVRYIDWCVVVLYLT